MLGRVQRGLERLYRIDTALEVDDFVIADDARRTAGVARAPREQLLLSEDAAGELALGLYVDPEALDVLGRADPARGLHDGNLGAFLLVVEGVSHFVYVAWRAQRGEQVSALELELQAEVDKYVTCLLTGADPESPGAARSAALRRRLFDDVAYDADLDGDERDRYRAANDGARAFAASLERRYVARGRVADMLHELRGFFRLSLSQKLAACR